MNEQQLRALIRETVARHLRQPEASMPAEASVPAGPAGGSDEGWRGHASHQIYVSVVNTGESCVIEPGVPCNHCNYCKSHGH
jgi:hypothetical protein